MLTLKHGGHRWNLSVSGPLAATTQFTEIQPYDFGLSVDGDPVQEKVVGGTMFATAALAATGAVVLNHVNSAGTVVDALTLTSSVAANTMVDLTTVAATTGNTLKVGWNLSIGDSVVLILSTGATAQTTAAIGVMLLVGVPS